MNFKTCPKCEMENPGTNSFCIRCGTSLMSAKPTELKVSEIYQRSTAESSYYTPSKFSSSRYAALRGIASFCNGFAKAIAVFAGLGALISFSSYASDGKALLGFGSAIMFAAIGGFSYVILRVIAEGISVLLDIEANTKTMATISQEIYYLLDKKSK